MRRRIFVRQGMKVALSLAVFVVVLLVALFVSLLPSDPSTAAIPLIPALLMSSVAWVMWRGSHVQVSDHGVAAEGLFRRRWLDWDDISGFGRKEIRAMSARIYADTVSGDRVTVGGVPFYPLLFDSHDRHDYAVKRVLERLEEERRAAR